ncbi:MAG: hypothetical protein M0Z66_14615 [Thermaerobacter sp.]|nr:hypothetical protein [Thermaerobacter sp.]
MLLKWILKLIGFGFLLGASTRCGHGPGEGDDGDRVRRARQRAARRLHRFADAIAKMDEEDPNAASSE